MTGFMLKMIASAAMLIDHIGGVFPNQTPIYLRYIGRLAFPVYAFLIAEGCRKTRNINRYALRLAAFAVISQIPFDLAFHQTGGAFHVSFTSGTNVFYTLFLAVLCVLVYKRVHQAAVLVIPKGRVLTVFMSALAAAPIVLLGDVLDTDYGTFGVILVVMTACFSSKYARAGVLTVGIVYLYGGFSNTRAVLAQLSFADYLEWHMQYISQRWQWGAFAMISVLCVLFYNGKRGYPMKWFFYMFYPVHLLMLAIIKIYFMS